MTSPRPELSEKDFINEGYSKNPFPLWLWFFLLTIFMALLWGGSSWYNGKLNLLVNESPFLQVTNREISLFLWENPEYMRVNSKEKNAYLPAFGYTDKLTIDVAQADQYVVAPPELLFRYHTWKRLVSGEFTQRPIAKKEFTDFLSYAQEWHPRYWPAAPEKYAQLVNNLSAVKVEDLSTLPLADLPMPVRMAFQGWTNYFLDKEAINTLLPTYQQMQEFLDSHPHYARNYWRNIVYEKAPKYLESFKSGFVKGDSFVPANEMVSFLKVAVYNYLKAQKPVSAGSSRLGPKKAGV